MVDDGLTLTVIADYQEVRDLHLASKSKELFPPVIHVCRATYKIRLQESVGSVIYRIIGDIVGRDNAIMGKNFIPLYIHKFRTAIDILRKFLGEILVNGLFDTPCKRNIDNPTAAYLVERAAVNCAYHHGNQ